MRQHGFDRFLTGVYRSPVVSLGALSCVGGHPAFSSTRREISGHALFGACTRRLRYPRLCRVGRTAEAHVDATPACDAHSVRCRVGRTAEAHVDSILTISL